MSLNTTRGSSANSMILDFLPQVISSPSILVITIRSSEDMEESGHAEDGGEEMIEDSVRDSRRSKETAESPIHLDDMMNTSTKIESTVSTVSMDTEEDDSNIYISSLEAEKEEEGEICEKEKEVEEN